MLRIIHTSHRPKTSFARYLRRNQTSGEKVLWNKLRAKRFHGLHFRRQTPIGPYIVDFLCVKKRLIIEIDGDSHFLPGAKEYDQRREAYLRRKGFDVLRFSNHYTVESPDGVLTAIGEFLGLY